MESFAAAFVQMVEDQLALRGLNPFAVEQAAGLPPDSIRNVLRSDRKAGPTLTKAKDICNALGLDFYIGPVRSAGHLSEDAAAAPRPPEGYATVPWHRAAFQATDPHVALHSDLTRTVDPHLDRLAAVAPGGEPPDAALAIVDTGAVRSGGPSLWAILEAGKPRLRQLQFDPAGIIVLPGPGKPAASILSRSMAEFALLGRVVWTLQSPGQADV
jgi:hypothetical protein